MGNPYGIMAKVLDCVIIVSYKLLSCHNGHFQTFTLGKGMNPIIPTPTIVPLLLLYKNGFGIK